MLARGWASFGLFSLSLWLFASCQSTQSNASPVPLGFGGAGSESDALGQACKRDSDCGALHCLRVDRDYEAGYGGPSHGLCTVDCSVDDDCRGLDADAVCASLDEAPLLQEARTGRRVCVPGCSLGLTMDTAKCLERSDLACRYFAVAPLRKCDQDGDRCAGGGWCFQGYCRETGCGPRCNSDEDCGDTGRSCNPRTGLCDEKRSGTVVLGEICSVDDPSDANCGGVCLKLDTGNVPKWQCSQTCTLGQRCGVGGACSQWKFKSYLRGDIGYCMPTCDCSHPCQHPDDSCLAWENSALAEQFGSEGYCDVQTAETPLLECEADAGSGGAH